MKSLFASLLLIFSLVFNNQVTAQECNNASDCFLLATQYGNTAEAVALYDRALGYWTAGSDTTLLYDIYSGRGNAHQSMKDYTQALQDFNKIIQLRPKDKRILSVAYTSRGNVMDATGNEKGAVASYTKSIETYPPNMLALGNRAYTSFRMGEKDQAIADFKLWAELGSTRALSILYQEFQIDWLEAQKAALAKDEQWQTFNAERKRAKALVVEEKYQEAYELYIKVFDFFGERKDAEAQCEINTEQAYIQNQLKDYRRAIAWGSRAVYNSYATSLAYTELATAHYMDGNKAKAVELCQEGAEKFPNGYEIKGLGNWIFKTEAYNSYMAKDYERAYDYYYTAYDYNPKDVGSIKYAGHSAYSLKAYKAALDCYMIAVKIDPAAKGELQQYIDYCSSMSN